MDKELEKFKVDINDSIKIVVKKIELNKEGFVVVLKNKVIYGLVTDGDLRRYFIKGGKLSDSVEKCCNKNFLSISENISHEEIYKMLDDEIKFIPTVNKENELVNIITKKRIPDRKENNIYYRSKSPVRISFSGGGSDTTFFFKDNKGAVINATINLYCHSTLFIRKDKIIIIKSLDLEIEKSFKDLDSFLNNPEKLKLIASVIKILNPNFGFELFLQSDFPPSSGLGGSSALLSSIIGCFNELRKDKWNNYEISEIAYQAERLNLGIDGGWQDQYATVFGGLNFIEFNKKKNLIIPLRLHKNILLELEDSLILCYTKTNHGKDNIHEDQKLNTKKDDIKNNINKNVKLAYYIRDSLLRGDLDNFSKYLKESWELKKSYSKYISNSTLNHIYESALKNGASSGKLLGAGGGGFFLFFVKPEKRNKLIKWLHKEKLEITNFTFEKYGLRSWTYRKT